MDESSVERDDAALEAIAGCGELSDPPASIVPKLALLTAVAEHLELQTIVHVPATGGCAGLLTTGVFAPLPSSLALWFRRPGTWFWNAVGVARDPPC